MANYLTQEEDGTSRFILEEGGGFILLEADNFARVSQDAAEIIVSPTDAMARVSQDAAEIVIAPTDAKARLSAIPIEIVRRANYESVDGFIIDANLNA